jgi:bacterioferritin-associated ferredoxin
VTPFTLNAGCGGVSIYFGGFSFISGEEIKNLIQSVAQNAVGVAIELVMTTLCGQCAHVMQVMRSLAKDAARTAIDSCEMARSLMERGRTTLFGDDKSAGGDKDQAVCSGNGAGKDWIDNMYSGLCNGVTKAVDAIEDLTRRDLEAAGIDPKSDAGQDALCDNRGRCNTTWNLLKKTKLKGSDADSIRARILLMNVIGTNVKCGGDADCKNAMGKGVEEGQDGVSIQNSNVVVFPPTLGNAMTNSDTRLNMQDVFDLYMCGTNWENAGDTYAAQQVIDQFCAIPKQGEQRRANLASRAIWDCMDTDACLTVQRLETGASSLQGNGYLPKVVNLMQTGITAIRNNSEMPREVIDLIQITPVPLYQAINAAAVYPDAGGQLLAVMGTYVAQLMTYADLRDVIRNAERMEKGVQLDEAAMDRIYSFLGGMRATTEKAQLQIGQQLAIQQSLMEQIRMINIAMQREVLSEELLGPARFGTAVNEAAAHAAGAN